MHIDADDTNISGALVQGEGESYHVCAIVGRELQITEAKCGVIERLAMAAAWCVKKLNRCTTFLASGPGLTIIYPHAAEVTCMSLQYLPVRLQAWLIKLPLYGCKFTCSDGTWAVSGAVACVARDAPESYPTPELHT